MKIDKYKENQCNQDSRDVMVSISNLQTYKQDN